MGLMDKIKNIFTEEVEEDVEIKVEQIKKEVRSVPIESPTVENKKEKQIIEETSKEETIEVEKELEEKAKTPVFFTDRDFEDLVSPKKRADKHDKKEKLVVEEKKKVDGEKSKPYGGSYSNSTIIQREKQLFKPTPIISPVYGVLDKNYHKEDIVDRKDRTEYISVDGLSVDSIRNKAYGTLEDDLEDAIFTVSNNEENYDGNETMDLFDELESEDNVDNPPNLVMNVKEQEKNIKELEEITMDLTKELDNLLMKKESFNKTKEELIHDDKKEEVLSESDLFNLIDLMYGEGTDEE